MSASRPKSSASTTLHPSSQSPDPTKPKREFRHRANPNSFPKGVRWMLEVDYYHKLTPAEKAFLHAFHEAEYGGNGQIMHADHKEVQRLWVENKKQQADVMGDAVFGAAIENRTGKANQEDVLIETIDRATIQDLKAGAEKRGKRRETALLRKKRKRERKATKVTPLGNA